MACAVAVMVVAGMLSFAEAGGGGINWKTKDENPTDQDHKVDLQYGAMGQKTKSYAISNHTSHTFETGAECPTALTAPGVVGRCTNGSETDGLCSAICADSTWKIKKYDDGKYHFHKE